MKQPQVLKDMGCMRVPARVARNAFADRNRCALQLSWLAGMRVGETAASTVGDMVDAEGRARKRSTGRRHCQLRVSQISYTAARRISVRRCPDMRRLPNLESTKMQPLSRLIVRAGTVLAFAVLGTTMAVAAPTVVSVTLSDAGLDANANMPTDLGMAMPGADSSKATMMISAAPTEVPAGEVTFTATNASKDYVHEMILVKVADASKQLPYVAADFKVDEDAAGHLGEVSELDPGKSGSLTLKLDPGTYMLFCNIPGHYMAGMWTMVTVK